LKKPWIKEMLMPKVLLDYTILLAENIQKPYHYCARQEIMAKFLQWKNYMNVIVKESG